MDLTKAVITGVIIGFFTVLISYFFDYIGIISCVLIATISYYYFRSYKLGAVCGAIVAIIGFFFDPLTFWNWRVFNVYYILFNGGMSIVIFTIPGAIGGYFGSKKPIIKPEPRISLPLTIDCPSCGMKVARGVKFCPNCGFSIAILCPNCGADVPVNSKFCPKCGTGILKENGTPIKSSF